MHNVIYKVIPLVGAGLLGLLLGRWRGGRTPPPIYTRRPAYACPRCSTYAIPGQPACGRCGLSLDPTDLTIWRSTHYEQR